MCDCKNVIFPLGTSFLLTLDFNSRVTGRKFCFVVVRFWLLSSHEGPEDPEATHVFRVDSSEDGSPQKKVATAVYE